MNLYSYQDATFLSAYNVLTSNIVNKTNHVMNWFVINPGCNSHRHAHIESEFFIVISGNGVLLVGGIEYDIHLGDVIELTSNESHSLENRGSKPLILISVVREPSKLENLLDSNSSDPKVGLPYVITSTPPTPNGNLHLGHLSGPYLRADILRRTLICQGRTAAHVSGQDDFQSYTVYTALQENRKSKASANYYGQQIKHTLSLAKIELERFQTTADSDSYQKSIQKYIKTLYDQGDIYFDDSSESSFCETCQQYLYEVYVVGKCPHCNAETSGTMCEACGIPNDNIDLIEPRCRKCNTIPKKYSTGRYKFRLSKYRDAIKNYLYSIDLDMRLFQYAMNMIEYHCDDIAISHDTTWGIPLQLTEAPNVVLSVWFEMGLGHLYSNKELYPDENYQLVQFFGFDNSFFNTILFPATFIALGKKTLLAKNIFSNEFYCLEKKKFSTSRRHAIWGNDAFKEYDSDSLRYYLCITSPEQFQNNFSLKEYEIFEKKGFLISLKNSINNFLNLLNENFKGQLPCIGLWNKQHKFFFQEVTTTLQSIEKYACYQCFSPQNTTRLQRLLLETLLAFQISQLPNCGVIFAKDYLRTSIVLQFFALKVILISLIPISPDFALTYLRKIGINEPKWTDLYRPITSQCPLETPLFESCVE